MPNPTGARRVLRVLFALVVFSSYVRATNVLSYRYDQQSTGQDLTEAGLTPATVVPAAFMKRWTRPADGYVYAQPLYLEGVNITAAPFAGVHNTVFVATENDTVYALDSGSSTILWKRSLLTNGLPGATSITPVPSTDTTCTDIVPQIGITGTPVIDPVGGYLYVTAKTKQFLSTAPTEPSWVYTLFKVSLANGSVAGSSIIAATYLDQNGNYQYRTNADPTVAQDPFVPGKGYGTISVGGQSRVYFNVLRQLNRAGALLYNGSVYLPFGSLGDLSPYHGWLLSFNAATLALNGVFNTTPNGGDGGIWQGGGIATVDSEGCFYFMTGNGSFDGNTDGMGGTIGLDANGFPAMGDYGDCVLKVALDPTSAQASQNLNGWGFKVMDYFAPMDNQTLAANDKDLGSGGVLILPDSAGSAAHQHLLVGAGKEGTIYLIDRDNMGKFSPYTDNTVQSQAGSIHGSFCTPAYFNGNIYWVGTGTNGEMFSISGASLSTSPVSQTSDVFSFPGGSPAITAAGTSNGLVWTLNRSSTEVAVYSAENLSLELYNSNMAPNSRDALGSVVKFATPTVADGSLFVGGTNAVYAYFGPAPPTSAPAAPTNIASVVLSASEVDLAWTNNATNGAGYSVEESTNGVTYTQVGTVGANLSTAYIVGLAPSTIYNFRVRAYNAFDGLTYSAYTNPTVAATLTEPNDLDFTSGFGNSATQLNYAGSATLASGSIAQLTNGTKYEAGAIWSQQPQDITRFDTAFNFLVTPDGLGFADGFTFCIQNVSPTVTGSDGGNLGYAGINNSIAIKFDIYPSRSTTGLYVDGAPPNDVAPPAIDVTSAGIYFNSGHIFNAHLTYGNGVLTETITDTVTGAEFGHQYTLSVPGCLGGAATGYVGFTAGTGSQTSIQQIQSWIFAPLPLAAPTAPSKLTALPASSSQINLAWQDNSTNETGFFVERLPAGASAWSYLAELPANTVAYQDTGLAAGASYTYAVCSSNGAGVSALSNFAAATTLTLPAAPAAVRITSMGVAEVDLAWTNTAPNAASVIVSRQQEGSGRHTVLATLPAAFRAYADKTVSPGVHYTYYIQASNLAGPSKSTTLSLTTPR